MQDSEGRPQVKMLKALREDKLQGDFVTMREPRPYMGYIVSPHAYAERYFIIRSPYKCVLFQYFFQKVNVEMWLRADKFYKPNLCLCN